MPTLSTKPEPDVALDGEEECCFPCWKTLPDHIFLHIFSYLDAASLHKAGLVSKAWLRVAFDELLWKDLFYRHWQISRTIPMAPGKYSWIQEYKRLLYHTPSVESEVLKQHADQVLHVSFSHNGKMFATCSKDGFIRVWDATYPTSLKYKADMRKFTWKYTQFSQFNSTDTLLLVSGVHFGSLSTSGEIAVFNLEGEFVMQSRVMNKPYDVFGTWYNDCYLLSGNLHWTGHLNSCSAIWLNKAYQETNSEEESVVMRLFKFSNINASSIRTIMVSKCLGEEGDVSSLSEMPDGGSTSQADINIAAIGEDSANQEAENIMEEEASAEETCKANEPEPSTSGEGQKKKTSKNVQSIQVYENGSFITKFLEVDDDEPNNKLNGTIQYSSDYRLAETPVLHPSQLLHRETSGSDMSERSPSGNLSVSDNSEKSMNVGSDLADNRCSSTEMEMSKSSTPDWSEELDSVQPHTADIDDSKASDVSSDPTTPASVQTLVHFHMSTETALCLTDYDGTDVFSTDCKTVNVNTNNAEDEPVCTDVLENLGDTGDVVESTKKRVLLGQQQTHGEIIRDPSPCDQLGNGRASSSSLYPRAVNDGDEVKIEKFEGEVDPKLTFCCVDYKKTKRMSSVTPLTDLEINSPSAGTSRSCAQSTICAVGTGTQSDENFEIQSSSSDVNIDCMPVKPIKCNILSENENTVETSSAYVTAENRDHQNEMETASQFPKQVCIRSQKSKSRKVGDKYLIFTKGSKTYTPHQIGIKRIKPMKAFSADGSRLLPNVAENTHNMDQGQGQGQGPAVETYDDVDHLIDMHGHIIGMSLSPDHRYLYVNSRPWPKNYHIENPLYPPPIAQEIDIHVIDLLQMREVGTMHRSHKAYTSNDECFFIFLDVCEEYVASGAEDKHGYLWDRHYGLCLHKYPHSDVVNSVAFNPSDPEVLVTVSDDFSIKIWRSHSREKEVVKAFNREHCIRLNYVQSIMSDTNTEEYTKLCLDEAEKT